MEEMNRKGGIQAFINAPTIIAVIILIFVLMIGAGGAFEAAFDVGKFMKEIPIWFWVVLAMLWLANQFRK